MIDDEKCLKLAKNRKGIAQNEAENDYFWQVKVWDKNEKELISETAVFEMGKMSHDWEETKWIAAPEREKENSIQRYSALRHNYSGQLPRRTSQLGNYAERRGQELHLHPCRPAHNHSASGTCNNEKERAGGLRFHPCLRC